MLKLFIFCLILLPCLSFSQINYQTTVQIQNDFQANTFEENDRKVAKEYFDTTCIKIETSLKTNVASDQTLGISFGDKNASIVFQMSFYIADEGEGKITYLKFRIIDITNKHEISVWRYPYTPKKAINFKETIEAHTENLDGIFEYNPLYKTYTNLYICCLFPAS